MRRFTWAILSSFGALIALAVSAPFFFLGLLFFPIAGVLVILTIFGLPQLVLRASRQIVWRHIDYLQIAFYILWLYTGPALLYMIMVPSDSSNYELLHVQASICILFAAATLAAIIMLLSLAFTVSHIATMDKPLRTSSAIRLIRKISIVLLLFAAGYFLHFASMANYAVNEAQPFEKSLAQNGAVRICYNGDPGRGPDNSEPWYNSNWQLNVSKEEAEKIIYKVARDNGFELKHEDSPYESIEWYKSSTTKNVSYPGRTGTLRVSMSLYNDTKNQALTCGFPKYKKLTGDESHSAITLAVGID